MIPLVDLNAQYQSIRAEIDAAIKDVIETAAFIRGPQLDDFEKKFAALCGSEYACCVGSGTEALHLALLALGIGPGDEVVTVTNTWISTAFAISHVGATPVLVDVDPETYQMDPLALESAITPRTKAVVAVHLYGHPAPMQKIKAVCNHHGLYLVEDVAQAILAEVDGVQVGTIGDIGCYSFYPSKNLGCFGDGGAVITNSSELGKKLKVLADYGQTSPFVHEVIGFNSRLNTLQATVLSVKMKRLVDWNAARRRHAQRYISAFADLPIKLPTEMPNVRAVYHLFVIETDQRDACRAYLHEMGVSTQIHYPTPIHLQPCYRYLNYNRKDFPVAEAASERILSLPIYPELSAQQMDKIINSMRNFFGYSE